MAAVAHKDTEGLLRNHGYQQLKMVGQGSFGKALLVQSKDEAKLICKMVDVSHASKKEIEDSTKEAKILAAFKHPYIVRYRESFVENGWLCILMDFCEGGDLASQIQRAKKKDRLLPEEQVLVWMTQALLALKYIHEKHVLHRDLKSANFFLSRSGTCKMGDFGIAKVLSCTAACAKTQTGTPYYLSPEICTEKPYAWPSDIWAMGVILYEMCERKVPFDANNLPQLVQRICREPVPPINADYSEPLKLLCRDMLSRDPSKRPSAETALGRPQMQEVVKKMLNQHRQSENKKPAEQKQPADTAGSRRPSRQPEAEASKPAAQAAAAAAAAEGQGKPDNKALELPAINKPPSSVLREPSPGPGRGALPTGVVGQRQHPGSRAPSADPRRQGESPPPRLPSPAPSGQRGASPAANRSPSPAAAGRRPSPARGR
eukprot:TRINITY_DN4675_c2_g1_i1.p1 TRINITY_DN4675_c2_g1~~TRINITY_DN4675_c2_g1_i1.p1  ORF type:complete len:431 (-),score=102.02 TRINITY_DN4675_c2_g1_i1:150-1442(-)